MTRVGIRRAQMKQQNCNLSHTPRRYATGNMSTDVCNKDYRLLLPYAGIGRSSALRTNAWTGRVDLRC
jgi:hypothetical protein